MKLFVALAVALVGVCHASIASLLKGSAAEVTANPECVRMNMFITPQLTEQANKAGDYSMLISTFADRPIWRQNVGPNWVWYCPKFSVWVITDQLPNMDNCQAGLVSMRQNQDYTPRAQPWKYLSGGLWYDDAISAVARMTCYA
eukprot:GDKH01005103.1.p1 GENE.GDKH01005103.1~~GDKH01005103.1.p1  ORF type:complete len:144 (+),score=20.18 GDKH01005103.1:152-583(+)